MINFKGSHRMIKNFKNHYIFSIAVFTYLIINFNDKSPFWGLMDDATSIRLSKQFSNKPFFTTIEWVAQNNSHGMFRPFLFCGNIFSIYFMTLIILSNLCFEYIYSNFWNFSIYKSIC